MIVEFIGLPGSGKSTIARKVHFELIKSGISCALPVLDIDEQKSGLKRAILKLYYSALAAVSVPLFTAQVVHTCLFSQQKTAKDLNKCLRNFLVFRILLNKYRKSRDVFLFDESLLQAIWSLGLGNKDINLNKYIPIIYTEKTAPDLLIYTKCLPETIFKRVRKRNDNGRFQKLISADPLFINIAISNICLLVKSASQLQDILHLTIGNDDKSDINATVSLIKYNILQHYNN